MAPASPASDPSLEELFEFERLLFDLSVRFANVSADLVVDEIDRSEPALLHKDLNRVGDGRIRWRANRGLLQEALTSCLRDFCTYLR